MSTIIWFVYTYFYFQLLVSLDLLLFKEREKHIYSRHNIVESCCFFIPSLLFSWGF